MQNDLNPRLVASVDHPLKRVPPPRLPAVERTETEKAAAVIVDLIKSEPPARFDPRVGGLFGQRAEVHHIGAVPVGTGKRPRAPFIGGGDIRGLVCHHAADRRKNFGLRHADQRRLGADGPEPRGRFGPIGVVQGGKLMNMSKGRERQSAGGERLVRFRLQFKRNVGEDDLVERALGRGDFENDRARARGHTQLGARRCAAERQAERSAVERRARGGELGPAGRNIRAGRGGLFPEVFGVSRFIEKRNIGSVFGNHIAERVGFEYRVGVDRTRKGAEEEQEKGFGRTVHYVVCFPSRRNHCRAPRRRLTARTRRKTHS